MAEANQVAGADQHPPNRLRKGTTSCQECKRRKIRCLPNPDNGAACFGCQNRGVACISQEVRADRIYPSHGNSAQIQQRLSRVENFLQTLVQMASSQEPKAPPIPVDAAVPLDENNMNVSQNTPIFSSFHDALLGARNSPYESSWPEDSMAETPPSGQTSSSGLSNEHKVHQTLSAMLPSQHDADLINAATNAWALVETVWTPNDNIISGGDINAVSQSHPTMTARAILHLAICMQQLPPEFDASQLLLGPNIGALIHRYTTTVTDIITSNDELMSTLQGLECLLLLGLFQIMVGNLRRAWITFRRALNIAQLMSFHRDTDKASETRDSYTVRAGRYLYRQIIYADRYLCAILGMPCGSKDTGLASEEPFQSPKIDLQNMFKSRLSIIAGSIIERNQAEAIKTFTATQAIIDQIDELLTQVPTSWWEIPNLSSIKRSAESSALFGRLIIQMSFFQFESLLHLPFMLRNEQRYEYSRCSCLRACREVIYRFLALRKANTYLCCRGLDFAAFTSALMLVLGLSSNNRISLHALQEQFNDRALVKQVVHCMAHLAQSSIGELIATQSVDVLKTLLAADEGTVASNLRLIIPYFGTITIGCRPVAQSRATDTLSHSQQLEINPSIISFASSQFPSLGDMPPIEGWEWIEGSSYYFDSLLSSDLPGNWAS